MSEYRLVQIDWLDSAEDKRGWRPFDTEEPPPLLCQSVGWLVIDGEKTKVIVPTRHDGNEEQGVRECGTGGMKIPAGCVVRIADLAPPC